METLLAGIAVLAVVVLVLAPLLGRATRAILAGEDGAGFGSLWTYWWVQKRAAAWLDPYRCDWVLPPDGAHFGFDTHALLPTLVTAPLGRVVGTIGAYNLTIVALLAGGALVLFAHLRRSHALPWPFALGAALCFAIGRPSIEAAHSGPAHVSAVFWGGALAILYHSYARDRFSIGSGAWFAAAVWACYWTSLGEVLLLVALVGVTVPALELARLPASRRRWKEKLLFLVPLLPGLLSLRFLANRPPTVAGSAGVDGLDPERLVPAVTFAGLILAALGARSLWNRGRAWSRAAAIVLALGVAFVNRPPAPRVAPVRRIEARQEGMRANPAWRVLVVPKDRLRPADDSYQVVIDGPFVNHHYLETRLASSAALAGRFPRVYRDQSRIWDVEWGRELVRLEVGYLLLADSTLIDRLPPELRGNVGMSGPDGVLVAIRR